MMVCVRVSVFMPENSELIFYVDREVFVEEKKILKKSNICRATFQLAFFFSSYIHFFSVGNAK